MGELSVEVEHRVPAELARVWSYVVERYFEHHAAWDPAIAGMEKQTAGEVRTGTRGTEVRAFMGKQRADFEVTACEPRRRFAFANTSGPFELEREYTFAPDGSGTTLAFRFRMRPRGPMKLVFPLMRGAIAKQVRANVARIPALVAQWTG